MPVFNDSQLPKPGEKVTRGAKPTWAPCSTLRPSIATPSASTPNLSAAVAAPLKTDLKAVPAKPTLPKIEPYNPYPSRNPAGFKMQTSWGDRALFAFAFAFAVAALCLVSVVVIQKNAENQIVHSIDHLTKPLRASKASVGFSFSKVKINLFRQTMRFDDLVIDWKAGAARIPQALMIQRLVISNVDWSTLKQMALTRKFTIPQSLAFKLDGVRINENAVGPEGARFLQTMGYDNLVFALAGNVLINKARTSFALNDFKIEAPHVGRLDVSLDVDHFMLPTPAEIARLTADPKLILNENGEFTKLALRSFVLKFTDDSLVSNASEAFVKLGEAPPVVLAEMALEVNRGSRLPASGEADFVTPAFQTLVGFLKNPGVISLQARPAQPVQVISLIDQTAAGSFNALAARWGLTLQ